MSYLDHLYQVPINEDSVLNEIGDTSKGQKLLHRLGVEKLGILNHFHKADAEHWKKIGLPVNLNTQQIPNLDYNKSKEAIRFRKKHDPKFRDHMNASTALARLSSRLGTNKYIETNNKNMNNIFKKVAGHTYMDAFNAAKAGKPVGRVINKPIAKTADEYYDKLKHGKVTW